MTVSIAVMLGMPATEKLYLFFCKRYMMSFVATSNVLDKHSKIELDFLLWSRLSRVRKTNFMWRITKRAFAMPV